MPLFFAKYWLHLVALAAISLALALVVRWIREDAIQDNNVEWQDRIQKLDDKANEVVKEIRGASVQLASNAQNATRKQDAQISAALADLRKAAQDPNKAGTFVKPNEQGVCQFTPEYLDSLNKIRDSLPK